MWARYAAPLVVAILAGCNGSTVDDAGDAEDLVSDMGVDTNDVVDESIDAEFDASDAVDVPVDVAPAVLPGRWRLVGWQSMGAGGSTDLADVDRFTPAGHARVNGTMQIDATSLAQTFGLIENGHFDVDTAATPAQSLSAWSTFTQGTLGDASFTPSGASPIAFHTNADGTVTEMAVAGTSGRVALTWQRADVVPSLSAVVGQGLLVRLAPSASDGFVAPRAALVWDRPGIGNGYSETNDVALTFIAPGVAAINVSVTAPPSDAVGTIDGTSVAVAYLVVYDDRDRDGRLDLATAVGAMDGGVTFDASLGDGASGGVAIDVVRGLSPVAIAWRGAEAASSGFRASPFRELVPGVQVVLLRQDPSVPGGTSLGLFDTTHVVPPDGIVESGTATFVLPDLPGPM